MTQVRTGASAPSSAASSAPPSAPPSAPSSSPSAASAAARAAPAPAPAVWLPGIAGAVIWLGFLLSLALLAYAPLGRSAAGAGMAAALATALIGAPAFALLAGSPVAAGGPSSATCVVIAGLVAQVLAARPADPVVALAACTGAAVLGMGLVQMLLGLLRLGRLAGYVPQPVLSGFMNGVALLVVLAQLPALLGLDPAVWAVWHRGPAAAWAAAQPWALALGLGTAAVVWAVARRRPRWPAPMIALAAGTLVWHGARTLWPGAGLGPTLGAVAAALPLPPALTWWSPGVLAGLHLPVATAALVLALTGSLESLLSLRALDQQFATRSDPDRCLRALGAANIAGGLLGALPMAVSRNTAAAAVRAGGRGRPAMLAVALFSAVVLVAAEPAVEQVPRTAVAGVMLMAGLAMSDRWSRSLLQRARRSRATRDQLTTLATVSSVAVVTAWAGTGPGLLLGLVLASAAFTLGVRGSVIRTRASGEQRPSRRIWPAHEEALLAPLRHRIRILELQGALFFGTAQRVADEADALAGQCSHLVLDLRRLGTVDDSGAAMLQALDQRLAQHGTELLLASVDPARALGRQLAAYATGEGEARWFPDADRAVEAAERTLLAAVRTAAEAPPPPLSASGLLRDLSAAEVALLDTLMPTRAVAAGELLFSQGDRADGLYVVTRGAVSVTSADGSHRYASFGPGTLFGEMAVLDGEGRTADARADGDGEVRWLPAAALDELQTRHPALAARVYRNIARHTSLRLRVASVAWQSAAA